MKEKSTETGTESRPAWESLETLARQGVQRLLQQLLEDEVEEVLGRRRYERRTGVDAPPGYRNGWGKPRRLSAMAGTITVRRPRVRGLEAREPAAAAVQTAYRGNRPAPAGVVPAWTGPGRF